jgi:DNA mismatch repair protein MSH2
LAKQFTVIETQKSGVKFTNAALTAALEGEFFTADMSVFAYPINTEHNEQLKLYEMEQETIVKEVATIARGYCEVFDGFNAVVAKLDVLVSFAQVAASAPIPFVRPTITAMGAFVCVFF